jgi:hypothetical protein
VDVVIDVGDQQREACLFSWLAFGKGDAMEIGVAEESEGSESLPDVLGDFQRPRLAIVEYRVQFFSSRMTFLDPQPFDGATTKEEMFPANGGLRCHEGGFIC